MMYEEYIEAVLRHARHLPVVGVSVFVPENPQPSPTLLGDDVWIVLLHPLQLSHQFLLGRGL
jgi:hypothetical protein